MDRRAEAYACCAGTALPTEAEREFAAPDDWRRAQMIDSGMRHIGFRCGIRED